MTRGLTQGMAAYRMLGLSCGCCMPCLNNRMLNSGYGSLMFQVLKQKVLCVLYHVKAVFFFVLFCFLSPTFGLGYISIWKINVDQFSIHWIAPPSSILCLCSFSFVFLFLLHSTVNKNPETDIGV